MRMVRAMAYAGSAALLAAGCAERPEPVETGMAGEVSRGTAMLRVVHAAPGTGELSVYHGYEDAAGRLGYLEVAPWRPVAAGEARFSVVPTSDARGEATAELDEELEAGGRYTLVTYDAGGRPAALLLEDEHARDPDLVRLRVLNLIHDGPEVELFRRGERRRLLDDVEPGEMEEGWVAASEGALEFRREGERGPYLVVPNAGLVAGRGVTLVLTGEQERPDVSHVED